MYDANKVMIVNGDEVMRRLLQNALVTGGYDVFTAIGIQEALNVTHSDPSINVVIAELDMPDVKDIEVIKKLREAKSDLCVIVVTAHGSIRSAVDSMREGAFDYITKPFNDDEIRMIVQKAVEWQKARSEEGPEAPQKGYEELSLVDKLTGVYNYPYMQEVLSREIVRAKRYPENISLLLVDLDDFRQYNQAYGQTAGDEILCRLGALLRDSFRKADVVARYGGEEFAIITPQTSKEGAFIAATRLLALVRQMEIDDVKTLFGKHMTVSIGVVTYPDDAQTKETLLIKAEQALYLAKHLGKNRACFYGIAEEQ